MIIKNFGPLLLCALFLVTALVAAQENNNPPMKGFNAEASDSKAVEIADRVMEALGGRENWDNTRFVSWKFFGRRLHVWDKWTGDIRIDGGDYTILMNLHSKKGRAWQEGEEVVHPDSLAKMIRRGESIWINDSYWMFMPYKLKDSGVTLKYLDEGETIEGGRAHVLQLTFENIGDTPNNKYLVYVDTETSLVLQWDFFTNASDDTARFSNPWRGWEKHGTILLSANRGKGSHSDIRVFTALDPAVFTSSAPVAFDESQRVQ